jgi:hypothetical protein
VKDKKRRRMKAWDEKKKKLHMKLGLGARHRRIKTLCRVYLVVLTIKLTLQMYRTSRFPVRSGRLRNGVEPSTSYTWSDMEVF